MPASPSLGRLGRRVALAGACAAAALGPGCDLSPTLDIETPAYAPAAVLRAVLAAGSGATVRVTVSRDPYGPPLDDRTRPPSATPAGARVTLLRDGRPVEELVAQPQTCYGFREATCNAVTGRMEVEQRDPYECGAFVGAVPVEAGATYTLRAELPGLPPAEATVAVPARPEVFVEEGAGTPETRRLHVRLRDLPGAGSRYGLSVHREYDRYTTGVCRVGGLRDTTIVPGWIGRYQTRFGTADAVLLAGAREPGDALRFVAFPDDAFEGGEYAFAVDVPADDPGTRVGPTGRLTVQLAALSPVLYDAYQITYVSLGDGNPFAEPVNLPTNVEGGYGRVGAVAVAEQVLPARPGP